MASLLSLRQQLHFTFDKALDLNVREGFRAFGDKVLAGVQWTGWQRDERIWDFRRGQWRGGLGLAFMRSCPDKLRLKGATEETTGTDPIAQVAPGNLTAQCELSYQSDGLPVVSVEFQLYSCATGAVATRTVPVGGATIEAVFPDVAWGSYVLWARAFDGLAKDDPALNAGEWSALKVVVGAGAFEVSAGVCPSPGCPLYMKDGDAPHLAIDAASEATARVLFDPLARSVSASCLTEVDIELNSGTVDVPQGSQIIAGLRASRSGPQSALWLLNENLSARLLAVTEVFSTGMCECGKSDHHASDVAQAPDGTLYLLSECSLHRYAPDNATIGERLPGSPASTGGHPGGQTLRFMSGRTNFFTEIFEDRPAELGTYYYSRLIQRLGGLDVVGPGPAWHGPSEAEVYRGKFWGFRGVGDPTTSSGQLIFDSIDGTAWSGKGVPYNGQITFWRQLRRRGELLFWFGFNPGVISSDGLDIVSSGDSGATDTPICAVCDGQKIRLAKFEFFAKRITRCRDLTGGETLLVAGNDLLTGQELLNGGRALSVAELPSQGTGEGGGGTKVCSFWNDEEDEFRLTRAAFEAAGGDLGKLPPFLGWKPRDGANGGGVWHPQDTQPSQPYLSLDTSNASWLAYALHGAPPYNLSVWGQLCFTIDGDGGLVGDDWGGDIEPEPSATDAQEALEDMPEGTKWRVIEREVPRLEQPLSGFQLTDLDPAKALSLERQVYPTLWARFDSSAPPEELSSYTRLLKYGRAQPTPEEVKSKVEVVVLVSPDSQPCTLPALSRRFS